VKKRTEEQPSKNPQLRELNNRGRRKEGKIKHPKKQPANGSALTMVKKADRKEQTNGGKEMT